MTSLNLHIELLSLFEKGQFQTVLDRAQLDEITPAADPKTANVVAAAYFSLVAIPSVCFGAKVLVHHSTGMSLRLHAWCRTTPTRTL